MRFFSFASSKKFKSICSRPEGISGVREVCWCSCQCVARYENVLFRGNDLDDGEKSR